MAVPQKMKSEQRQKMIAEAAYYRAERRGFRGGDPVEDWVAAEIQIDTQLTKTSGKSVVARLEEQLAASGVKLKLLRAKASSLKAEARKEWEEDLEKLVWLRDALEKRLEALKEQGEQAGHKTMAQAEKLWHELSSLMHRMGSGSGSRRKKVSR